MARHRTRGACSDAEVENVIETLKVELAAVRADDDASWVDDLPEGEEFDDRPGSTLVLVFGKKTPRRRTARRRRGSRS